MQRFFVSHVTRIWNNLEFHLLNLRICSIRKIFKHTTKNLFDQFVDTGCLELILWIQEK